jgi:hydroxypyruvate isomerase
MKNIRDLLSANISILFTEVPFLDRFELAAKHGFKAVECWFPYEFSVQAIRARLEGNGLKLVGINSAPGEFSKGQWGLAANSSNGEKFRDSIKQALHYAAALSVPNVHVMAGMLSAGQSADSVNTVYCQNIAWACEQAQAPNINVLIEPLNPVDRPGYFLSHQAQARQIVTQLSKPNLKVMFDVYHVQMTEGQIISNLHASLAHIGHIQIADVPGRHEPGTGEIHFVNVIDAIAKTGYFERGGWLGCEYKPKTQSADGLRWRESL